MTNSPGVRSAGTVSVPTPPPEANLGIEPPEFLTIKSSRCNKPLFIPETILLAIELLPD